MGRRRKSGRKSRRPDDYFAAGPFEFARFGKTTIGRSRATREQMAEVHKRMAEAYPALVAEIGARTRAVPLDTIARNKCKRVAPENDIRWFLNVRKLIFTIADDILKP